MDTGSLESALSECNISQLSRLAEGASKWNLIWDQPTDGYFVAPSGGDNAEVAGLIKECKDVLTPIEPRIIAWARDKHQATSVKLEKSSFIFMAHSECSICVPEGYFDVVFPCVLDKKCVVTYTEKAEAEGTTVELDRAKPISMDGGSIMKLLEGRAKVVVMRYVLSCTE